MEYVLVTSIKRNPMEQYPNGVIEFLANYTDSTTLGVMLSETILTYLIVGICGVIVLIIGIFILLKNKK